MASTRSHSSRTKDDAKGIGSAPDVLPPVTFALSPPSSAAPPSAMDATDGISLSPAKQQTIRVTLPRNEKTAWCPICGRGFPTTGRLRDHLHFAHAEADVTYQCAKCEKEYANLHPLECHVPKCTPKKKGSFVCGVCFEDFGTLAGLSQHNRYRHPEDAEKWRNFTDTINKKAIHTVFLRPQPREDGNYFCDICKSSWKNLRSYSAHRRHQHKKNPTQTTPAQEEPNKDDTSTRSIEHRQNQHQKKRTQTTPAQEQLSPEDTSTRKDNNRQHQHKKRQQQTTPAQEELSPDDTSTRKSEHRQHQHKRKRTQTTPAQDEPNTDDTSTRKSEQRRHNHKKKRTQMTPAQEELDTNDTGTRIQMTPAQEEKTDNASTRKGEQKRHQHKKKRTQTTPAPELDTDDTGTRIQMTPAQEELNKDDTSTIRTEHRRHQHKKKRTQTMSRVGVWWVKEIAP